MHGRNVAIPYIFSAVNQTDLDNDKKQRQKDKNKEKRQEQT